MNECNRTYTHQPNHIVTTGCGGNCAYCYEWYCPNRMYQYPIVITYTNCTDWRDDKIKELEAKIKELETKIAVYDDILNKFIGVKDDSTKI